MAYRPVPVTEFADLYSFSASQMSWAARNSLAAHEAQGLGNTPAAEALREFISEVKDHVQIRFLVTTAEKRPLNPLLALADRKVDTTYAEFVSRVHNEIKLYGVDSVRGRAALKMLDSPLGMPVKAVTQVERVEQESMLKGIIRQVEQNFSEEVITLELTSLFELLKKDATEFVRLMTLDTNAQRLPSRSKLEEDRKVLQAKMLGCMYRILGAYPGLDEDDMEMRSVLLGPFAIQKDRIADYMRRRRGGGLRIPPEVHEETGEFIDETVPGDDSEPEEPAMNGLHQEVF